MTPDEIIRMAREAGADFVMRSDRTIGYEFYSDEQLERFAALVAAHEREECAKVCDEQFEKYGCVADKCAAAIRARSNK